jgi:hypothetical protein
MHDFAEAEVADHVYRRDDLERRQLRHWRQRMRRQRERCQAGRGPLIVTSSRIAASGSCASLSGVRSRPMVSSGQRKRRLRW